MQAGIRCFTNRKQASQISLAIQVRHHATAGVMCCGYNGDGFFGDVNAQFQTFGFDVGEMFLQKFWRFV